ncbi:MAG: hypothetical protein AAB407_02400 [Patescibacteria group bacterium]
MPQQGFGQLNRAALGRERLNAPQGAWRLMLFMSFVFGVFVVSYFGLAFGYKAFLSAQIVKAEEELALLASEVSQTESEQFLQFQYQIINLQKLLQNHVFASRISPLVEASTNQRVFYTSMSFDSGQGKVALKGSADTYQILAEQLEAYQRMTGALDYQITNTQIGEKGRITFEATITLDPKTFKP